MKTTRVMLQTLCSLIKRGITPTYVQDDGILVLNQKCVRDNRISFSESRFTDKNTRISPDKFLKYNDILVNSTGTGTLGRTAPFLEENRAKEIVVDSHVTVVRPDFEKINPLFLALVLARMEPVIVNMARGATNQVELSAMDLGSLLISVPSRKIQDRISEVVSKYDYFIENNRRRIQLLEQAARLLYKEWFVHLRFPGHEHVKIKDGVPEGWKKTLLHEIAEITMGQSPQSKYYNEDGTGLPFHQGVTNFGVRFPTNQMYCTFKGRMAGPRDILFSVRAPVGRINLNLDKIIIGRGLAAIRSNRNHQNFLFYQLKNHFFKEDMMGGGAIFAAITKKDLHNVELIQPPSPLIAMFMEHVFPIDRQIETLNRACGNLTSARDILLPRLMNGDITA